VYSQLPTALAHLTHAISVQPNAYSSRLPHARHKCTTSCLRQSLTSRTPEVYSQLPTAIAHLTHAISVQPVPYGSLRGRGAEYEDNSENRDERAQTLHDTR